jgi:hypothetical protein
MKNYLSRNRDITAIWAGVATFLAYFCMYMFRKPYTSGSFGDQTWGGIDYKTALVIAQVLGYALSKLLGIKIISELKDQYRIRLFLGLVLLSAMALVGFAFTPRSLGPLWLFINGVPLGLIWGIVFSYAEGRKFTEMITVMLCANFILSSGIAKSIGKWIMNQGISEYVMPITVGAVMIPLFLIALWMLDQIPPPTEEELILKTKRNPMTRNNKMSFLKSYKIPVLLFVLIYLILTIIRDIRDNFAVEIWESMGFGQNAEIYTLSEVPIALMILISLSLLYKITDNLKALKINALLCLLGVLVIVSTTLFFQYKLISPLAWMIMSGTGLFLPYILLNGIIFDRFIANYRIVGNVGFVMYISDASGYLGSVAIMLFKNFGTSQLNWLNFFIQICLVGGIVSTLLVSLLLLYFYKKNID